MSKSNEANDGYIFLDTNPHLSGNTKELVLLYVILFLFEISSASFALGNHIPHGFPRLIYLEIHLVNTQMNDLVYY